MTSAGQVEVPRGPLPDALLTGHRSAARVPKLIGECAELGPVPHESSMVLTAFARDFSSESVELSPVDTLRGRRLVAHALHAIAEHLEIVKPAEDTLRLLHCGEFSASVQPPRLIDSSAA